jgi:hypothetical protein
MPFGLGFFATAGAGGAAGSFDLLETQVLGSSQATVTFSSLNAYAATYQHLQIRVSANVVTSAANQYLRFNGSTSSYSSHYLEGTGSSVISGHIASVTNRANFMICNADSNNFAAAVIDILDPFETSKNKTIRSFAGSARSGSNWLGLYSGAWYSTDAITSIELGFGNNWTQYSRFSLYGIKAA